MTGWPFHGISSSSTLRAAAFVAACVPLTIEPPVAAGQPALIAARTATPPTIDGAIGEQEWQGAATAGEFVQYEPQRGARSPFPTEAFVLYDDRALYVAFRATDPEAPLAQLTQRDADLFSDDAVIIVLDSFFDRQSAYYFMTNPLGANSTRRSL